MEITEVRIKLMEDSDDRLQAFCSITFDNCFVVRDLKIIDGSSGPFVAMPSRKLTAHCGQCGCKNHLRAAYCNQCGQRLKEERAVRDADGRTKLYADIAHPINSTCREMIQQRVISEFQTELERSKLPGYVSRYDDDFDDDIPDQLEAAPRSDRIQAAESEPRPPHLTRRGEASGGERVEQQPAPPAEQRELRHRGDDEPAEGDFGKGIF